MSHVKKCGVVGIHMLDMFARRCARNQMTDVSVEVNCRHSPIIGYTRSSYTGMRYTGFRATFRDPFLEPRTVYLLYSEKYLNYSKVSDKIEELANTFIIFNFFGGGSP